MTGDGCWRTWVRDRRWCPGDLRFPGDVRSGGAVRAGGVGADGVADAEGDRELGHAGGQPDHRGGNAARRHAWAQICARHGALPGVRLADKTLDGVTCIRLDATVTFAHSDKELAEANFKGFGHHPLLAVCDNTGGEPLAWELRRGSALQQHRRGPHRPGGRGDHGAAARLPAPADDHRGRGRR